MYFFTFMWLVICWGWVSSLVAMAVRNDWVPWRVGCHVCWRTTTVHAIWCLHWHNFLPPSDLRTHSIIVKLSNYCWFRFSQWWTWWQAPWPLLLLGMQAAGSAVWPVWPVSMLHLRAGPGVAQCCSVSVCSLIRDQPRLRRLQFPLT